MLQNAGSQLLTADGAVGSSGVAVRVFTIHIVSGGTAAIVSLKNGTAAGSTNYVTETGTISTGRTIPFGVAGFVFPAGCFVDVDVNTTSVLVSFNYLS